MDQPSPAHRVMSWLARLIPSSAASLPLTIEGRYRLESLLGQGGTGDVYRARDLQLDRIVAVKLVKPEVLPDAPAQVRFRADAEALSRLHHRSIVEILDVGAFPGGGGYIVMELVSGEDLRKLLHREGRLGADRALPIIAAVCEAVDAAHRAGVLHRDLKPENILLPTDDADVKVLDFGVAKAVADGPGQAILTAADPVAVAAAGAVITGTPAYMAPEQLQGAPFETSSDVFSLGVLAYEMLSGVLPFGRGSVGEIALAHTRGAPPMPQGIVPAAAERAIRLALDVNPDRRPSSPSAFAHLLAASLQR
jgi:serine/threonine-protein kinase